ncbi:hypothetical protein [Candidatus Nitrosocosmicus sp. R]
MSNVFNNETAMVADNKKLHSNYEIDGVDQDDLDEQIIMDLFGKILKNFEELENVLSYKTENEKNRFLSDLLFAVRNTQSSPISE